MPSNKVAIGFLNTAAPFRVGVVRMRDVGGNSGGIVTDLWSFRLTFAGVTLATGCRSCSSGFFLSSELVSGALNGSYDLDHIGCVAYLVTTAFQFGGCTSAFGDSYVAMITGYSSTTDLAGYVTVIAGHPLGFAPGGGRPGGGGGGYLFYGRAPLCDFQDGMVISNLVAGSGCYTPPSSPTFSPGVAMGSGGNVTITKLPCRAPS